MIKQVIVVILTICPALFGVVFDDSTSGCDPIKSDIGELILDDDSVLVIDNHNYNKTAIMAAISDGLPLISHNKEIFDTVGSFAFYDDSDYYGYYRSPNGTVYCYSAECGNSNDAYRMAIEWASEIEGKSYVTPQSIDDGTTVISEKSTQCEDRGIFSVITIYSYVGRDNNWDYWTVKYYLESNPQNGNQTVSMKITDDLNSVGVRGELLRHGPNTTTGTSTTSVSITLSVDSFSASIGTEYAIPEVKVINDSSVATNVISISHVLSRNTMASQHTYFCEPIAIIRCDPGDVDTAFCPIDNYSVTFEKNNKILGYIDNWSSKTLDIQLQAILYPDR